MHWHLQHFSPKRHLVPFFINTQASVLQQVSGQVSSIQILMFPAQKLEKNIYVALDLKLKFSTSWNGGSGLEICFNWRIRGRQTENQLKRNSELFGNVVFKAQVDTQHSWLVSRCSWEADGPAAAALFRTLQLRFVSTHWFSGSDVLRCASEEKGLDAECVGKFYL